MRECVWRRVRDGGRMSVGEYARVSAKRRKTSAPVQKGVKGLRREERERLRTGQGKV